MDGVFFLHIARLWRTGWMGGAFVITDASYKMGFGLVGPQCIIEGRWPRVESRQGASLFFIWRGRRRAPGLGYIKREEKDPLRRFWSRRVSGMYSVQLADNTSKHRGLYINRRMKPLASHKHSICFRSLVYCQPQRHVRAQHRLVQTHYSLDCQCPWAT